MVNRLKSAWGTVSMPAEQDRIMALTTGFILNQQPFRPEEKRAALSFPRPLSLPRPFSLPWHRLGFFSLVLLFLCGVLPEVGACAPSHAAFFQDVPKVQDPPPAHPIELNRAKVLNAETDDSGRATAIRELARASDAAWLKARIIEEKPEEISSLVVFRGILLLSRGGEDAGIRGTCLGLLQELLDDAATHAAMMIRFRTICLSGGDKNLLAGAVSLLGSSRDLGSVEILLGILGRGEADLQALAALSLKKLTYENFGTDAAAWKAWWTKNSLLSRDMILEKVLRRREDDIASLQEKNLGLVKGFVACNPKIAFDFIASGDVRIKRFVTRFMLENASNPEISGRLNLVVAHLGKGEQDRETLTCLLSLLGQAAAGTAGVASTLISYLGSADEYAAIAAESLNALHKKKVLKTEDYAAIAGAAQTRLQAMKEPGQAVTLKKTLVNLLMECGSAGTAIDVALLQGFAGAEYGAPVRKSAIQALGVSRDPNVLGYLKNVLVTDSDGEVRFEAAFALKLLGASGKVEVAAVVAALAEGLGDLQGNVRSRCVIGLGTFRTEQVVGILLEHLKTEADGIVCKNCIDTLGNNFRNDAGLQAVVTAYSILKGRGLVNDLTSKSTCEAMIKICEEVPDRFLAGGDPFFNARCFSMAAWCAERFLEKGSYNNGNEEKGIRARAMQVRSHYHAGNLKRALPLLKTFEKNEIPRRERLQFLAEGHLKIQDFKNAATSYDAYLSMIPEAEAVLRKQVQGAAWTAHFKAKQFAPAMALAEVLKNLEPANNLYLYNFAISLLKVNRPAEAEKEFQRLLSGRLGADEVGIEWQVRCELAGMLLARGSLAEAQKMIGTPDTPLPKNLGEGLLNRTVKRRVRIQEALEKAEADARAKKAAAETPKPAGEKPKPAGGTPDPAGEAPKPAGVERPVEV